MEAIEYECRFLDMLGYTLEKMPNEKNNAIWYVIDDNHQYVGYLREEKISSRRKSMEPSFFLSYRMHIESDTISYNHTRKVDNDNYNHHYEFKSWSYSNME